MVVDANYSSSRELGRWLCERRDNVAVLTDYFYMEAYRRGAVDRVQRSFEQLALRPRQVVVLWGTNILSALPPRERGAIFRMTNHAAGREFPDFIRQIQRAAEDPRIRAAVEGHIAAAELQFAELQEKVAGFGVALAQIADAFHPDDLRAMRRGEPYSERAVQTMLAQIANVARFGLLERGPAFANRRELAWTYVFRATVCSYLMWKTRIEAGTLGPHLNEARARNDLVDSNYAAVALYFDGLLTDDEAAQNVYLEARVMMDTIFLPSHTHEAAG